MTALTHAVVDGGMASHLAFSIGAIAQLAEYRIVYPVVAGSNPAGLANLGLTRRPARPALTRCHVTTYDDFCIL